MKRFFAVGLILLALCLCGCSTVQRKMDAKDIGFVFSCKAEVSSCGSQYTCAFRRGGPQDASVQVLSETGKGLVWYWSGDGFTQTYYGLSAKSDACVLPKYSFASVLVHTLDSAEKPGALTPVGGNEFSGTVGGCGYTLSADAKTGNIVSLTAPDWDFKASFFDYGAKP